MRDTWVENRRHVKNYPHGRSVHIPRSVLNSLERICTLCGERSESKLAVHHVSGNSLDNSRCNLEVLCRACHLRETPRDSPYIAFLDRDYNRLFIGQS